MRDVEIKEFEMPRDKGGKKLQICDINRKHRLDMKKYGGFFFSFSRLICSAKLLLVFVDHWLSFVVNS